MAQSPFRHLPLTELQQIRINAALVTDQRHSNEVARGWLSPRQLKMLDELERRRSQFTKVKLDELCCIGNESKIKTLHEQLTQLLNQ